MTRVPHGRRAIAKHFGLRSTNEMIRGSMLLRVVSMPLCTGVEVRGVGCMHEFDLVRLRRLMGLSSGRADVAIGLIDGPVEFKHPELASLRNRLVALDAGASCASDCSNACQHGTFIAGMLCASRGSGAPALCPGCTLLVCPIFTGSNDRPGTTVRALSSAIDRTVAAGARVLNISLELARSPDPASEAMLVDSLDAAARGGVLIVAAAGNGSQVGSSVITKHPWVIPVVAFDHRRRPLATSNLGHSIGKNGIGAPGHAITSLAPDGKLATASGTSISAPFVTGTIALLLSLFPKVVPANVRRAIAGSSRRSAIVPPLLDAFAAYRRLGALSE